MMNPAYRELLGKDRSTSETGHGSDEAMDGAKFRNVVGFLARPTTTKRSSDTGRSLIGLPGLRLTDSTPGLAYLVPTTVFVLRFCTRQVHLSILK